jgi:hypothetical protein
MRLHWQLSANDVQTCLHVRRHVTIMWDRAYHTWSGLHQLQKNAGARLLLNART